MTNQPKWLISAYATFFAGGVVVPLDYKLTAEEHLQLLTHSKARVLFVEYPHWRAITQAKRFASISCTRYWLPKRRRNADLAGRPAMGGVIAPPTQLNSGRARERIQRASFILRHRRPPERAAS